MLKINKVNKKNKKEEIKHLPSKQAVEGSNPSAFTKTDTFISIGFFVYNLILFNFKYLLLNKIIYFIFA